MNFERTRFASFTDVEKAYAISQTDPFHDMPYRLEGAPSDVNTNSVVMVVNQERVITAATFGLSVAAGEKWDMHVCNIPILQPATFVPSYIDGAPCHLSDGSQDDDPVLQTFYPVTVSGNATSFPTFIGTDTPFVGLGSSVPYFISNESSGINIPRTIRVIGVSYEIVDETPKFYQQGACTVYNRPSSYNKATAITYDFDHGPTANLMFLSDSISAPLNRIEQATIIPNSKTWKASEGCYVVCRQNTDDNEFQRPMLTNVLMYAPNDPIISNSKNSFVSRESLYAHVNPADPVNADSFNNILPYNITGAYFTGLSSQYGTYRLRTKIIYEIIPDPTDSSLIPLATPSVPRNSLFEDMLRSLIAELPFAVQQTMNPKGEFWGMILKAAKKAVNNPVTDFVASKVPGGQLIQAGTKTLLNAVPDPNKKNSNKNKNKGKNGGFRQRKIVSMSPLGQPHNRVVVEEQ